MGKEDKVEPSARSVENQILNLHNAVLAMESDNPSLKGVLPKDSPHPSLDKQRLVQLIDLARTIGRDDRANRCKDILGLVYEYYLSKFASAESKKGSKFYKPRCVVRVLVGTLTPYNGRVYDPCCGSAGLFIRSEKFVEAQGGKKRRCLQFVVSKVSTTQQQSWLGRFTMKPMPESTKSPKPDGAFAKN